MNIVLMQLFLPVKINFLDKNYFELNWSEYIYLFIYLSFASKFPMYQTMYFFFYG